MIEAYAEIDGKLLFYYRKYYLSSKGITTESSIMTREELPLTSPIENFIMIDGSLKLDKKIPKIDSGFFTLPLGIQTSEFNINLRAILEEGIYRGARTDGKTYSPNKSISKLVVYPDGTAILDKKEYSSKELLGNIYLTRTFEDFIRALTELMCAKSEGQYSNLLGDSPLTMYGGEEIKELPTVLKVEEVVILHALVLGARRLVK